ncbi:hypothetical protein AB6A40_000401 [Gnathostoma spinigerum]|uniref:Uncharacterized protein n=1 Tax=Gnathostoma spinigerum TaxID=75299 RepID=A0ABD6E439_9BILA
MRRFFLCADAFISSFIGLFLFFFPNIAADFIFQRKSDGVHWHLLRCIGGQLLGGASLAFRLRNSSADTVAACYVTRVLGGTLSLMLIFHCKIMTPNLVTHQYVQLAIYAFGVSVTLHLLFHIFSGWQVAQNQSRESRFVLVLYQLDSLASIAIGATWMTFPKWLLHRQVKFTLDESHELCGRFMGVFFIAYFIIGSYVMYWKNPYDRYAAVDSRVLVCISILAAQVWSQLMYTEDWGSGHWIGISLFSTWTTICILYRIYVFCMADKRQSLHSKNQ